MPIVYELEGISIKIYFVDHDPEHLHAKYAEYEVKVEIKTKKTIKGKFPKPQMKKLNKWMEEKEEKLLHIWDLAVKGQPVSKIWTVPFIECTGEESE